jgi:hypothetical protein
MMEVYGIRTRNVQSIPIRPNLHQGEQRMKGQPPVPNWIRQFSYANWTNVFQLAPKNRSLYPVALSESWKPHFNDWTGKVLFLAKDGCPTRVIRDRVVLDDAQPWRYGQRELGDEMGWKTNERLFRFASAIPGGKLYGSAAANMLYDDDRSSRSLTGFYGGPLHDYLRKVLSWVLESMPQVEWVACLGDEAWFLTCTILGNRAAAKSFKQYRDSNTPIRGSLAKTINAFPLYHPAARVSHHLMEQGRRAFEQHLLNPKRNRVHAASTPEVKNFLTRPAPQQATLNNPRCTPKQSFARSRIVTANLPVRWCRVKFTVNNKTFHISREYHSRNIWPKIIDYARSKRGGAPVDLPPSAIAVPQVLTEKGWVDDK